MKAAGKCLMVCIVLMGSGCGAVCKNTDCNFHAYGGIRDRIDRVHGRVGSAFDPAESLAAPARPIDDLPPLEDESSETDGTDAGKVEDGNIEDSELRDELLDKIRGLDPLPQTEAERDSPTLPDFGEL